MRTDRFADPTGLEIRSDRAYDEQTASHLIHPNGSVIDCFDRELIGAMTREVLRLHREASA